jgi:Zn-dependent protease with chaperone function
VIVAAAARPLSERFPPRVATWVLTVTSLVLTVTCAVTLGVLAVGGAIRIPEIAALGHLSLPAIQRSSDTSLPVALLAGLALAAGTTAAVRAGYRQSKAFRNAAASARELVGHDRVAVVDDAVPDAFAVPGRPGRVIISTGMLAALDDAERGALLAHEYAHLDCRHHYFRTAVELAAAANPLLRPVRRAVVYATERWADERAAAVTGDRRVAARAIGKAALAGRDAARPRRSMRPNLPMLNIGGPGPVPRRVAALLAPPPRRKAGRLAVASAAVLVLLSLVSVQGEATDLHALVEHAQMSDQHRG